MRPDMTMKKILTVVSLLLSIVSLSMGQDSAKAKMVRAPFFGGDALHAIQEVALDFKEHATDPADRVAVRLCSKNKLRRALRQATASPFVLQEYLEHHGFNARRILFLRSEDCLAAGDPSIVVTEFWVIPKGAAPPTSVESITAEEAAVYKSRTQPKNGAQDEGPVDCETLLAHLDHAIIEWLDLKETHLILIARLGTRERDRNLSLARLRYVEEYLQKKKVQYVLAEGSRVDGLGRFEIYVGGRLRNFIPIKKGSRRLCYGKTS